MEEEEELSFQEVEELLESVIHNKKLAEVESNMGEVFVVFSHASSQDILASRYIRQQALIEARKVGLPSREEIDQAISKRSGLSDQESEEINNLESQITGQRRLLALTRIPARKKSIEENIERMVKQLAEMKSKNESFYSMTQEFRADEEALLYLAWASTFKISGERYWPTFKDYEKDTDIYLRDCVLRKFGEFNRGIPIKDIRYLARHVLWRIRYTAGLKIGGPLFPQGLHELTTDQQSLLYWSNFYQSIYEMLPDDQPSDEIIEDDEALDAYMASYFKRREQERSEGRLKRGSRGAGKLSSNNSDEVIVTANHPEYLSTVYSDKRIKAEQGADVEVIAPNSRRARNRRAARNGR